MELLYLKEKISEWINVSQRRLHEISLEDVVISEDILSSIDQILSQLDMNNTPLDLHGESSIAGDRKINCFGYWIENTKDLVIYLFIENQSRTIIIPWEGWMIRSDITIN